MTDFVIVAVVLIIIGAAVCYMIKAKKSGVKCIGCPAGGACSGKQGGAFGCHGCSGSGGCGGCNKEDGCACHGDTK